MQVLDLFSGIGGMSLGLEAAGFHTILFVEKDLYCHQVLRKWWPDVPIHDDVFTLERPPAADLVCGGAPCQPVSQVGKLRSETDERWLWPDMFRIVQLVRPRWVLFENVGGIKDRGLDRILLDLNTLHYDTTAIAMGAKDVGAPQVRRRIFVLAYADRPRLQRHAGRVDTTASKRRQEAYRSIAQSSIRGWPARRFHAQESWESSHLVLPSQSELDRRTHGIPNWMDRIRVLGNSVVPQCIEALGRSIMTFEEIGDEE